MVEKWTLLNVIKNEKYCYESIGNTFKQHCWCWCRQYFIAKVLLLVLTIVLTSIVNIPGHGLVVNVIPGRGLVVNVIPGHGLVVCVISCLSYEIVAAESLLSFCQVLKHFFFFCNSSPSGTLWFWRRPPTPWLVGWVWFNVPLDTL